MNKRDAKAAVGRLTAWSLRRIMQNPPSWGKLPHLGTGLSEASVRKVQREMQALADKLDPPTKEKSDA